MKAEPLFILSDPVILSLVTNPMVLAQKKGKHICRGITHNN